MHVSQNQLSLSDSMALEVAGIKAANEMQLAVSITFVTAEGIVIRKSRMDFARTVSLELSEAKAQASAAFSAPSNEVEEATGQSLAELRSLARGKYSFLKGGLPIPGPNGELIGAVGVDGADDPKLDLAIASRILQAYQDLMVEQSDEEAIKDLEDAVEED